MNSIMKRIISLVLCLVLAASCLPIGIFAAENGEAVDAALFFADLHTSQSDYKDSAIKQILGGVKNSGQTVSTVTSVGDAFSSNTTAYTGYTANIIKSFQEGLGYDTFRMFFAWSDHDRGADIENFTGLMYGDESTNYYIYSISMSDMSSATRYGVATTFSEEKLTAFTNTVAALDHTKPLFIVSHMPLHDRRDDNQYADEWYGVISQAAELMDVAFFWGHNHTSETSADTVAYYVAKNGTETLDVAGLDTPEVPNFTYLNAGYMSPASTGSTASSVRQEVVTLVTIYEDSIQYTLYNKYGVYTGTNAMNETVTRDHAAPETPEETTPPTIAPTEPPVTEPEGVVPSEPSATEPGESIGLVTLQDSTGFGISVTAQSITGVTASLVTENTQVRNALSDLLSNFVAYDINVESYTQGDIATVTLPIPQGVDHPMVYYVAEDGSTQAMAAVNNGNGTATFKTDHFTVYAVGNGQKDDVSYQDATVGSGDGRTAYVRVYSLEDGGKYLIVATFNRNNVAMLNDQLGTGLSNYTNVTVNNNNITINGTTYRDGYIELDNSYAPWTATASGNGFTLSNGTTYIGRRNNENSWQYYPVGSSSQQTVYALTYENYTYSTRPSRSVYVLKPVNETLFLNPWDNNGSLGGWYWHDSAQNHEIRLYKEVFEPGEKIYSLDTTESITIGLDGTNNTYQLDFDILADGEVVSDLSQLNGHFFFDVFNESDPHIITAVSDTGLLTLSGETGAASVKIGYTWEQDGQTYTIYRYTTIRTRQAQFSLEIQNPASDTLKIGSTLDLDAIAKKDGADYSTENITWSLVPTYKPYTGEFNAETAYYTYDEENREYVLAENLTGFEEDTTYYIVANPADINEQTGAITADAEGDVTVIASWTDPRGQVHTDEITLHLVDAVWDLELFRPVWTKAETFDANADYYTYNNETKEYTLVGKIDQATFNNGTSYYTFKTEQIEKTIPIKNVEANVTTQDLWAVIRRDGESIGKLEGDDLTKLSFVSSDESIVVVDPATGIATFKGGEGTATVTAYYQYGLNENGEPKYVQDTIVFSVSAHGIYVPEDGTDDFPEYPKEGSIRFDKNANAVGTFSQTGIAKVELSMTGVPFTTNHALDVVLMLDNSTSMKQNGRDRFVPTKAAAKAFVRSIVINEDGSFNNNRIYVAAFMGGNTSQGSSHYSRILDLTGGEFVTISNQQQLDAVLNAIDNTYGQNTNVYGTDYAASLEDCMTMLSNNKVADRSQFCVFFSDGIPNLYQGERDRFTSTSDIVANNMFTTSNVNNENATVSRANTYQYESFSSQMKANGVTVFTVGLGLHGTNSSWSNASAEACEQVANILLNDISGPAGETAADRDTGNTISKLDSYFFSVQDAGAAEQMKNVFGAIAQKILEAAKDVRVEDIMGDKYDMVFDFPNTTTEGALDGTEYDSDHPFYIEVKEYPMNPETDNQGNITNYTRGEGTSHMKLYMTLGDVEDADGTRHYYASDANGVETPDPVFDTVPLGSMYYWTTDSTKSDCGISVTVTENGQEVTYYFTSAGDGTHTLVSGSYAYGTKAKVPILKDEDDDPDTEAIGYNYVSKDIIIATPYFVYNAATKKLVWTLEKLSGTEFTLSYFLFLENSGGHSGAFNEQDPGSYDTNKEAYLYYENFNGNDCKQEFPIPQLTWNGAQVTYVFYLVNDKGQPVNRAGRVVPFSEAVYITEPHTHAVVWNDTEESSHLEADFLAKEYVPDIYELYDPQAGYTIHVFESETEENLNNHFKIDQTPKTVETTYVFINKSDETKYNIPGVYAQNVPFLCKHYDNVTKDEDGYHYNPPEDDTTQLYLKNGQPVFDTDDEGNHYVIAYMYDAQEVHNQFDFSDTTVAFAVLWKPELVEDTVVIDYGLDVVIDVIRNDALAAGVVGIRLDQPDAAINVGTGFTPRRQTTLDLKLDDTQIATATLENQNFIRFSLDKQNGMLFKTPFTFYYESQVTQTNSNNVSQSYYLYSSVTVIPATTIYYEDEYVDLTTYTTAYTETVYTDGMTGAFFVLENGNYVRVTEPEAGQTYLLRGDTTSAPGWPTISTPASTGQTQAQDRPGASDIAAALDADNNYGYDGAYANMSSYSLGHSAKINVNATTTGTAEFDFYGTGFDVISLTSNKTGVVFVSVTDEAGKEVRFLTVDTYYGFTHKFVKITYEYDTTSGEWKPKEQVDVESLGTSEEIPADPSQDNSYVEYRTIWTPVTNGENDLYQVPIITVKGLTYGKYHAVITATYSPTLDHNDSHAGYDFYLDAIRIYDPTGNLDETANDAYVEDGEGWPTYFEVRDKLIPANSFTANTAGVSGIVFIDGSFNTPSIAEYESYGPNNEVYLTYGQSIAFQLSATASAGKVAKVQLAIKTTGGSSNIQVYALDANGRPDMAIDQAVNSATDMYYDITKLNNKTVIIRNSGSSGILSITNVKVTYTEAQPQAADPSALFTVSQASVDAVLTALRQLNEPAPEPTVPETTAPETIAPETQEVTMPHHYEEEQAPAQTEPTSTEAPDSGSTTPAPTDAPCTEAPADKPIEEPTGATTENAEHTEPITTPDIPKPESGSTGSENPFQRILDALDIIARIADLLFGWLFR